MFNISDPTQVRLFKQQQLQAGRSEDEINNFLKSKIVEAMQSGDLSAQASLPVLQPAQQLQQAQPAQQAPRGGLGAGALDLLKNIGLMATGLPRATLTAGSELAQLPTRLFLEQRLKKLRSQPQTQESVDEQVRLAKELEHIAKTPLLTQREQQEFGKGIGAGAVQGAKMGIGTGSMLLPAGVGLKGAAGMGALRGGMARASDPDATASEVIQSALFGGATGGVVQAMPDLLSKALRTGGKGLEYTGAVTDLAGGFLQKAPTSLGATGGMGIDSLVGMLSGLGLKGFAASRATRLVAPPLLKVTGKALEKVGGKLTETSLRALSPAVQQALGILTTSLERQISPSKPTLLDTALGTAQPATPSGFDIADSLGITLEDPTLTGKLVEESATSDGNPFTKGKLALFLLSDPKNAGLYQSVFTLLNPSEFDVDDEDVLSASQKAGMTKLDQADNLVQAYEDKLKSIGTEGLANIGLFSRLTGAGRGIAGKVGLAPEVKAYQDFRKGTRASLAKALGEVGTLSDTDKKDILRLIPTVTDSTREIELKLQQMRTLINKNKQSILSEGL